MKLNKKLYVEIKTFQNVFWFLAQYFFEIYIRFLHFVHEYIFIFSSITMQTRMALSWIESCDKTFLVGFLVSPLKFFPFGIIYNVLECKTSGRWYIENRCPLDLEIFIIVIFLAYLFTQVAKLTCLKNSSSSLGPSLSTPTELVS